MIGVLMRLIAAGASAQVCTEGMKGDGHCDQGCMTSTSNYDSSLAGTSDCRDKCLSHCAAVDLDAGNCKTECLTWDCAWGGGVCGECAAGCPIVRVGNGLCEEACNVQVCSFDAGDCIVSSSPHEVFVSSTAATVGDGRWMTPFNSLSSALESLWLPYNTVYLLSGSHTLCPGNSAVLLANDLLRKTTLRTLFCTFQPGDHQECALSRATIQVTAQFTSFSISHEVAFESVVFSGGFSLKSACVLPTCLYCPFVTFDTIFDIYLNDRGENIDLADYAAQSLCDFYHDKSFIVVAATGHLTIFNSRFTTFRQQLKSLIWNECGEIQLQSVDFDHCMAAPQGLHGGLIGQTCPDSNAPYDCGHFSYITGSVKYLNDGYEYRADIVTSGFVYADGLHDLLVDSVLFEYNFLPIGAIVTTADSSMLSLDRFRSAVLKDCIFRYNVASLSVGLSVLNSFQLHLIMDTANRSIEHTLTHITLSGLTYYNNTATMGTLLYVNFQQEHQNVLITKCTFRNNFSTKGALIVVRNAGLQAIYREGGYIDIVLDGALTAVWVAARYVNLTDLTFRENYASGVAELVNIGNIAIREVDLGNSGDSLKQVTAKEYVLNPLITLPDIYLSSASLAYPAAFNCKSGLVMEQILQIDIENVTIKDAFCPKGSPGIALIGSPAIQRFRNLWLSGNTGAGLISIYISTDISMENLTFLNNSNHYSSSPLCFHLVFTQPANLSLTNSTFRGNQGDASAVGLILEAKFVHISEIIVENNQVKYSGSGLVISPNVHEASYISLEKCVFKDNSAGTKGVLSILDFYDNLYGNFKAVVTLTVRNCQFEENRSTFEGAAVGVYENIQLSPASVVQKCDFTRNVCISGASLYLSYAVGSLAVASCVFESNSALKGGAGIFAHQSANSLLNPTFVIVEFCVFLKSAGAAIRIEGNFSQNLVIGRFNRFEGNRDSAVALETAQYTDTNSVYVDNEAEYGGGLFLTRNSAALVEGSVFERNAAREMGGAVYMRFFAPAVFRNCTFRLNSAGKSGGVLYTETSPGTHFEACLLAYNFAGNGSALYSFAGSSSFADCTLTGNSAEHYALFVMLECTVQISACVVFANVATQRTSGVYLTSSVLEVTGTTFSNQTSNTGGFILSLNHNSIYIHNSSFAHALAEDDGGAIYSTLGSQLHITASHFHHCTTQHLGGAIYSVNSAAVTINVLFESTSAGLGGAIDMFEGSGWVENCTFQDIEGSAIHADESASLTILNSAFKRGKGVAYRGSGVYAVDVVQAYISNSLFLLNTADKGGGAYFYSNAQEESTSNFIVTGNRFEGNRAPSGGGLESDGVNLLLANNTFLGNSAFYTPEVLLDTNGVGGALVLRCDNPLKCDLVVANNTFQRNSAEVDGGAVHWQETPPVFLNSHFEGNRAEYGDDIASHPIALAPISADLKRIPYADSSTKVPIAFTLDDFVSGQMFTEKLRFGLFDHRWLIVKSANDSIIELQVAANTTISGQFKGLSHAGVFEMSNFAVIAEPGTSRTIYFTTNGVDKSIQSRYNDSARYIDTLAVKVNFRLCLPGETLSNGACVVCQAETYSLDPKSPCKTCLSAALCYGGFTMVPRAGYWRARNDSETFFECLNAEACIGSPAPPEVSLTGICADGFMGNLCQVCKPSYSRTGRNNCALCPGETANISISALVILIALSAIALIVSLAIRGATRPRSLMATYCKIFLNYLQMVIVAASLNLNWPSFVKSFLSTQEMAGGMADQLFSFECLMNDFSLTSSMGMFAAKLMIGALLPLSLMLIALFAWGFLRLIKKVDLLFEKVVASCVVILFIVHPSITKMMFSVYSCMEINPGESWVIADLAEQCWTANHFKTVFFISVPSLSVWVLGLPTIVLGLLIRSRMKLHDLAHRVKFAFLYKGYEHKWFYWEFVILYRKIAIVSSSVFLSPMSVRVESLTILAILLIAVYLQLRYQPYNEPTLNKLEIKSILVSAVTIYAGLYYDTRSMSNSHIGQVINMLLFILIIVTNAYFLVTWLAYISPVIYATLREKWSFFARFSKPYRVQPFQPPSQGLKEGEKLSNSSSSLDLSSSTPMEGTVQPTDSLFPPANTPIRMAREATDPVDPGLNQDFSLR